MKIVATRIITAFVLGVLFCVLFFCFPPLIFSALLIAILLHILLFEWKNLFSMHDSLFWLIMPFYPILPFGLLVYLNQMPEYRNLFFILFIIIASSDMGAYAIGSLFGKHKIAPHISPGKSWEGFFGGFIAACLGLATILWMQEKVFSWPIIIGFSFLMCIIGTCGDLFESWLKRRAQIKDSGRILPGHGGFLDRFDSVLFAVIIFYVFREQLAQLFS